MLSLNDTVLTVVIAQATAAAAAHPRWVAAIARAVRELTTNPYIERDSHGLLIGSSSGQVYSANGVCQCTAYSFGQPCWHRAAGRLVRLHDEQLASLHAQQCPNCCAALPYADRCPAAQISADQAQRQQRLAAATAALNECFA